MARSLYVAAPGPGTGESVVALGTRYGCDTAYEDRMQAAPRTDLSGQP